MSFSRGRFTDDDPAGDNIPGALDRVVSVGITVEPRQPVFGSIRVRHFGPRPLIEDARVESDGTTLWNAELGYRFSSKARLLMEMFNLFDAKVPDVDYSTLHRLRGGPAEGVEDIHTHPVLPRSARVDLQLTF